jgi:hypothetical protein
MKRVLACFAALAPLAQNPAPTEDVRWLALADQAWRISEPRMILDQVREIDHSEDGAASLVVRGGPWEPGQGRKAELAAISWPEGRAARLLPLADDELMVRAAWSGDSTFAGVVLVKPDDSVRLLLIDLSTGRWASTSADPGIELMSGGPGALLIIAYDQELRASISIARRARPEPVPCMELDKMAAEGWKLTGSFDGMGRPKLSRASVITAWDAESMSRVQPAHDQAPGASAALLFAMVSADGKAMVLAQEMGKRQDQPAPNPRRPITPSATISRDATWAEMTAGDQAAYISDGVLFARRIRAVGYDEFLTHHKAAVQKEAMSKASVAVVFIEMFVSDSGGVLPSGDVSARLNPYLSKCELLEAISWTNVNGQPLKGILNPAATELGYLGTPFGDAVIFADGRVAWRSRP